jgi:4-nitrophenyl phosphatase
LLALIDIRGIIADLDGVVWRAYHPLPGASDFFQRIKGHIPYVFASNNSSRTVEEYVTKLNGLGIPADAHQIISSATATADYLAERYARGTLMYVIGGPGIKTGLQQKGFVLINAPGQRPDVVVVGIDRTLTYAKMQLAVTHIRNGAVFIGTNGDRTFPIQNGYALGAGSILAALESATDVTPTVIGKPEPPMFEVALKRLGTTPDATLVIGDRLETDILGAGRLGMKSALMLSGIAREADIMNSDTQPDAIYENLGALHRAFGEAK